MLIKYRIAIIFSLITALILFVFMGFVYINSIKNRESNFYLILEDRANLVAQAYLEKDELAGEIYEKVIEGHLRKLPAEEEWIIPVSPTKLDTFNIDSSGFTSEYLADIEDKLLVREKGDQQQSVAMYYQDNQGNFIIRVSARDEVGLSQIQDLFKSLLSGFVLSILLVFFASWFFATRVISQLNQITETVKIINASNLSRRFEVDDSKNELNQLAVNLNEMFDRLETGFQIQKTFVSNASHELKTPLTVIVGEADIALQKKRNPSAYISALGVVRSEAEKLTVLIGELLRLTEVTADRSLFQSTEKFRIEDILLRVQASQSLIEDKARIRVSYEDMSESFGDKMLSGNPQWLELAFTNIVKNALKYSTSSIEIITVSTDRGVKVLIRDEGIGIPKEELERILEPFYRASNTHGINGHGLGLTLVSRIVNLHNGTLTIDSKINQSTVVTVFLPFAKGY